ncbi:MAG: glutamate-1-semialdehyde 2,1-aminomutase [Candidatus Omnitrophota bacterium]
MKQANSKRYFKEASGFMPGGVNSPVRAFKAVGGSPIFVDKGRGCEIIDVDGNEYIDYVMSWGALILGHAHPAVLKDIIRTINSGTSFGAPTRRETDFCKIITRAIPSMQMLRLVNSGTEATTSAIRLSRGYTGKDKVVKFEGNYHGCCDSLLVKAGSGSLTLGIPGSAGVPKSLAKDTIVLPYNDIDKLRDVIKSKHREIACVILEPVCANMGVIAPKQGFLSGLRELTHKYGIILIFDEVICGFRFTFGGVQNIYGIQPDLTCLGKIIGGGLPIGAYGGRREIMRRVAPQGPVYQAGTLSGNPAAVSAGLATLKYLSGADYRALEKNAESLCEELSEHLRKQKIKFCLNRAGSMFTVFFTGQEVSDYRLALSADTKKYARYFHLMLKAGINMPPSQFEANFLSFAHCKPHLRVTAEAHKKVAKLLRR